MKLTVIKNDNHLKFRDLKFGDVFIHVHTNRTLIRIPDHPQFVGSIQFNSVHMGTGILHSIPNDDLVILATEVKVFL